MTRFTPQWLQAGTYAGSADRRLIGALWPTGQTAGVAVTVQAGMTLNISAGQVAVPTQNNTGSTLCSSDAVEQVVIGTAPAAGTNRIDIIVCQPRGNDLDGGANNDFVFTVIAGTVAASPAVPATPAGTVKLADVYVTGGAASIVAGNITDRRPGGLRVPDLKGAQPWAAAWGVIAIAKATANQTGIATGGTDIIGLQANFAQVAGRCYKVTGYVPQTLQQTAIGTQICSMQDQAAAVRQAARITGCPVGQGFPFALVYEYEPTSSVAGAFYKLRMSTTAGTIDLTMGTTQPGIIMVEDCGPQSGFTPPPGLFAATNGDTNPAAL